MMAEISLDDYVLNSDDLTALGVTSETLPGPPKTSEPYHSWPGGFIPTISLEWNLKAIQAAGYCGGVVSQAIWYAHRLRREKQVRLTPKIRQRFALSDEAMNRALVRMSEAGLLKVGHKNKSDGINNAAWPTGNRHYYSGYPPRCGRNANRPGWSECYRKGQDILR